jgi:hypothetical protein
VSAHDALAALAQDLVQEIASGMALELASTAATTFAVAPRAQQPAPPLKGAAAVHPQLGGHLARLPGDTISQHAYRHLRPSEPPIPPG